MRKAFSVAAAMAVANEFDNANGLLLRAVAPAGEGEQKQVKINDLEAALEVAGVIEAARVNEAATDSGLDDVALDIAESTEGTGELPRPPARATPPHPASILMMQDALANQEGFRNALAPVPTNPTLEDVDLESGNQGSSAGSASGKSASGSKKKKGGKKKKSSTRRKTGCTKKRGLLAILTGGLLAGGIAALLSGGDGPGPVPVPKPVQTTTPPFALQKWQTDKYLAPAIETGLGGETFDSFFKTNPETDETPKCDTYSIEKKMY